MRYKTPEQEAKAMAQRRANEEAKRRGEPLPHPDPWDAVDPTKVPEGATLEQIHQRYIEFCFLTTHGHDPHAAREQAPSDLREELDELLTLRLEGP